MGGKGCGLTRPEEAPVAMTFFGGVDMLDIRIILGVCEEMRGLEGKSWLR